MSRFLSRRVAAALALAAFLLPALPVSLLAHHDDEDVMACCLADQCRTPAMSAPCCSHGNASDATPGGPVATRTARDATATGAWEAVVFDLPTLATHWRARALAESIRGRPPDPPHLLNSVFLI